MFYFYKDLFSTITFLLFCFITLYLCFSIYRLFRHFKFNLPPGPFSIPFVGHFRFLGNSDIKMAYVKKLSEKYGSVLSFYVGNRLTVVVSDINLIREIVSKDNFTGRQHGAETYPGTKNIFEMDGSIEWKEHRRFVIQSFSKPVIGGIIDSNWSSKIKENIPCFITTLQNQNGQEVQLFNVISDELNKLMFKIAMNSSFDPNSKFGKILKFYQGIFIQFQLEIKKKHYFPLLKNILPLCSLKIKMGLTLLREIEGEIKKLVDERKSNYQEGPPEDVMGMYLKYSEHKLLNEKTVLVQLTNLIGIGPVGFTGALVNLLFAMALHPDKQEKMHQLIISEVGKNQFPEWSDRLKIPYMEAFIFEASRFYNLTGLPEIVVALEDEKIGQYDVPKRTNVCLNIASYLQSREKWGDPEIFRPERFLTEDGLKLNEFADYSLLFFFGKRSCAGKSFGTFGTVLYLGAVAQKFKISFANEEKNLNPISLFEVYHKNVIFEARY